MRQPKEWEDKLEAEGLGSPDRMTNETYRWKYVPQYPGETDRDSYYRALGNVPDNNTYGSGKRAEYQAWLESWRKLAAPIRVVTKQELHAMPVYQGWRAIGRKLTDAEKADVVNRQHSDPAYVEKQIEATVKANAKDYDFISPDGEATKIHNLSEFAREHSFTYRNLVMLIEGSLLTYKGWRLANSVSKTCKCGKTIGSRYERCRGCALRAARAAKKWSTKPKLRLVQATTRQLFSSSLIVLTSPVPQINTLIARQ